ncbi:MAG: MotA/TolQ/ExbB proton channel family protein [Planctomycetota bacterium]
MQRKVLIVIAMVAVVAFTASLVWAQPKGTTTSTVTLGEIFKGGGWIGWVIVGVSMLGLGLAIDNSVNLRREKLAPPEIIDEVEALFEAGDYQEAIELCEAEPNVFTNIVAAGLPKLNSSFEAMEKAIGDMTEEEAIKLHQRVGWLSFIANVSPMLGLLGTVWGMIISFKTIADLKGNATPEDLATGVYQALITTLFGLLVAIPITLVYVLFRNRVIRTLIEIAAMVEDLFERFRPTKAAT